MSYLVNIEIFISLLNCLYYDIKNIQMFLLNMSFISLVKKKNMYISFVASPLMKYKYFPLHSMK